MIFHPYEFKKSELDLLLNTLNQKTRVRIDLIIERKEVISFLAGKNKDGYVFKHSEIFLTSDNIWDRDADQSPIKDLKNHPWQKIAHKSIEELSDYLYEYIINKFESKFILVSID